MIGRNITLPCITKFTLKKEDIVDWAKGKDDIFSVIDGIEKTLNKSYGNRFSLVTFNAVLSGKNASLKISHVKASDEGSYCCCIRSAIVQCINLTLGKNLTPYKLNRSLSGKH